MTEAQGWIIVVELGLIALVSLMRYAWVRR